MALKITMEEKPCFKEQCEDSSYTKKNMAVKSVQSDNGLIETKDVAYRNYIIVAKNEVEHIYFVSNIPFYHVGPKSLAFSKGKIPWLVLNTHRDNQNLQHSLGELCSNITKSLEKPGVNNIKVKCTQYLEKNEIYNYPIKQIDELVYYDFIIEYVLSETHHFYKAKTPYQPRSIAEITNLEYLIQLDMLDLPLYGEKISSPSMVLAPEAISSTLYYLLWNKGNYQRKRKHKYYDNKLTVSSNPYNPCHAGIEKTVNGKKAKAVTLIKNGVLLHLPLNQDESKKAGQCFIPNSFKAFEIRSGTMPLKTILKNSQNTMFIYELRGDIGDDGSYSGIVKKGLIVENGKFTAKLINVPIFFNAFEIYTQIEILSAEQISLGYLLSPYIKFFM